MSDIKVTALGGKCCRVRDTAKKNAEEMKRSGKNKKEKLEREYKSFSDLLA